MAESDATFLNVVPHALARRGLLAVTFLGLWMPQALPHAAEVRYRVVNLAAEAAMQLRWSSARAINQYGDVAGGCLLPDGDQGKPFVYLSASGFDILNGLDGGAVAINNNRQVAVFGWVPGTNGGTNAWRYTPGVGFKPLGTLAGDGEIGDVPTGINNLGQVVGRSDIPEQPWQVAFLYTDAVGMVSLGSLDPTRAATAEAINDAGQITGSSGAWATLYTADTGMVAIGQGAGYAINNRGVVAGRTGSGADQAAIFENGATRPLGTLGGETWANGVNDHNVAVGAIWPAWSGFVWSEAEGMVDLRTLIEPQWTISDAWAINNSGQIAAEGHFGGEGPLLALRLDPIPPKLNLRVSAAGLAVSWSPAWPGLVLETTLSLTEPDWQPVDTGGTNVVSVPRDSPQRFFRLNLDGARGLCCTLE
jgi:probable HAF family extracellular repeat protein